jgi:hypothetical protein
MHSRPRRLRHGLKRKKTWKKTGVIPASPKGAAAEEEDKKIQWS